MSGLTDRQLTSCENLGSARRREGTGPRAENTAGCELIDLANGPEFLATVARWHYSEWGSLRPYDSVAFREKQLSGHLGSTSFPMTLVALRDSRPVGAVSVASGRYRGRGKARHWLTNLYVLPPHRRLGIGTHLMSRAVFEAGRKGVSELYLVAHCGGDFYLRRGWKCFSTKQEASGAIQILLILPPGSSATAGEGTTPPSR